MDNTCPNCGKVPVPLRLSCEVGGEDANAPYHGRGTLWVWQCQYCARIVRTEGEHIVDVAFGRRNTPAPEPGSEAAADAAVGRLVGEHEKVIASIARLTDAVRAAAEKHGVPPEPSLEDKAWDIVARVARQPGLGGWSVEAGALLAERENANERKT